MKNLLLGLGVTFAVAGAPPGYADVTRETPHYFVLLQDTATSECKSCGILVVPLVDAMIAAEAKARRENLAEQYARLGEQLPALSIPAAVRSAFCRKLSPSKADLCDEVTVIGNQAAALTPGSIVIRLSIEYSRYMRVNELRVIAALNEVTAELKPGKSVLYAWYVTPGTDATQASPLEAPGKKTNPKLQAARSYWFEGSPSRMESELLQSFTDIGETIRLSLPLVANQSWDSLPTLGELRDAGKLACKGASCRFTCLNLTDTRLSYVQKADAPVVMSVPIELWRQP